MQMIQIVPLSRARNKSQRNFILRRSSGPENNCLWIIFCPNLFGAVLQQSHVKKLPIKRERLNEKEN